MIDIHTHILPGVDDGAESMHEAYDMAEIAVKSGIEALVATPHSNHDRALENYESDRQMNLFEEFKDILQKEKVPLQIFRGMEIWASIDIPEKIAQKRLITLNQTQYLLVEFAFEEEPWWIEAILNEIQNAGMIPVIAHPERYYCVQDEPNYLYTWRIQGALAQMNKGSILGRFGPQIERTADVLLRHNLFTCIASDAHHAHVRTTDMSELTRYLQRYYSMGDQYKLLRQNPLAIIQGKKIITDDIIPVE